MNAPKEIGWGVFFFCGVESLKREMTHTGGPDGLLSGQLVGCVRAVESWNGNLKKEDIR